MNESANDTDNLAKSTIPTTDETNTVITTKEKEVEDKKEEKDENSTTTKKDNADTKNTVVSELVKLIKDDMYLLSIGCISLICSTLSNSAVPKALGKVIDSSKSSSKTCNATTSFQSLYADVPLLLIFGGGLASFIRTFTLNKVSHNIERKLRQRLFQSLMDNNNNNDQMSSTTVNEKEETTTSKSLVVMNDDIPEVSKMLTTTGANILRNLSSITYSSYNMLQTDTTLCLASVSIVPIIGCSAVVFIKALSKFKKQQSKMMVRCNEFWEERMNLLSTVQFYNRQEYEVEQLSHLLKENQAIGVKYSLWNAGFMGSMFISTCLALLGVVSYGMTRVGAPQSQLSSGNLTSFASYSVLLGLGTTGFLETLSKLRLGYDAAKRVFEIILSSPSNTTTTGPSTLTSFKPISMEIQNVSYSYPGAQTPALQDINLILQKGKTYALVGKNGVGKSTLVHLLSGSIQPKNGSISFNTDTCTNKAALTDLNSQIQRHLIGIVPQSPHLFNNTIHENIIYSKPTATLDEVTNLLNMCNINLDDPNKLIGKNGCNVSGGQRQRIALARVLLHDPQLLLVLDEPMNNLDSEGTEMLLSDVLLKKYDKSSSNNDAAMLLVTHNRKCLNCVDEIIVMGDGGKIIGKGPLTELEANGILDEAM